MIRKTRIFLVDDHAVLRGGMRQLIGMEPDFVVCGEASDAAEAMQKLPPAKPDVALLDLGLKGTSGLDLIKQLKQRMPKLPILVMSMYEESLYAERVLKAGARGYIMKQESGDSVITALRRVLGGKTYLSRTMSERMLDKLSTAETSVSPTDLLSDRELEVLRLLGNGHKPAAIASDLHLSVKTIETYREQIKNKLKLEDAAELTRYAVAWARSEPL
jgi:DNA-binding NarL/FixJ family response regulator